ncbi:MAG: relaxase domain-containing protein [Bifidobacteriaceae bacterium]|jgi:hypothetical protein|nr:relaxase domain-containing protein [Bifidobacteriaceae bacterium]
MAACAPTARPHDRHSLLTGHSGPSNPPGLPPDAPPPGRTLASQRCPSAAGGWRALDTAALFRQQGAIRALGTAVIAAHPQLADTLARHGLTLDPVTGEVAELEGFNPVMSRRSAQIRRNLAQIETEWEVAHPGQTPGPVLTGRMQAQAWAHERPGNSS